MKVKRALREAMIPEVTHANSIDDVIEQLRGVVVRSRRERDRLGIFAALYRRVTLKVKEGIESGRFEHGAAMERLVVVFANHYFEALRLFRLDHRPRKCWLVSFEAAQSSMASSVRHMLLGINAHINFDLGVAAAESQPADQLPRMKRDFDEINRILAEVFAEVRGELDVSWVNLLSKVDPAINHMLVRHSFGRARARAWAVALKLAALPRGEWEPELIKLDRRVTAIGRLIAVPAFG